MPRVHVAVGVVYDRDGQILISKRHTDSHQGGLWEFPGGKLEEAETVADALRRELLEELGIHIGSIRPLLEVVHDYSDKSVLLDVWVVENFAGEARGREGQPLRWVLPETLYQYQFPAANQAIVDTCMRLAQSRQS